MTEKYADELDRAAAISASHNEACIEDARRALRPQQEPNADGEYETTNCIECDDELPVERLKMGRILCVSCQDRKERSGRMYGR